jgi:hypothetical protein
MITAQISRSILVMVGLTTSLLATDPQPKIEDLAPWSVLGADKDKLTQAETLVLPPGAQLYRTISNGRITLEVQSSPVFGQTAADLPVLELGDAAVAFIRTGETGKLVLVLGNNPALTLPFEITLLSDGRSQESLKLTLGREGATVAVTIRGQTLHFPAGYTDKPQEIVLSAGESQAWPIQALALAVVADQGVTIADSSDGESSRGKTNQVRQQATKPTDQIGVADRIADEKLLVT